MYQVILGSRKGILKISFDKKEIKTITEDYTGGAFSYVFQDSRNKDIWACADFGHWGQKLYVQRNGKGEWQEKPTPKYPEGEVLQNGKPAILKYMWVMTEGLKSKPKQLFIGTEPGGLFESNDGGESFSLVRGLWDHPSRLKAWSGGGREHPGIHSILLDDQEPNKISVGLSCAGYFKSKDGGKNWAPYNKGVSVDYGPDKFPEVGQDTHCLMACPANKKVLWQQNHFGIFKSLDEGENWVKVSQEGGPANFGFPIIVDENDSNVAYVIPLQADQNRVPVKNALCVSKTKDGGKTWTAHRNGLPQKYCYDMPLRHAFDHKNELFIMGTTTGNLYASVDYCENWFSLSNHLPPIYSVRIMHE